MRDDGEQKSLRQAIGGYQRGASQGIDQNYELEVGAYKQIHMSHVDAAGDSERRARSSETYFRPQPVIAAVGREISSEVGQGMRIRF